MAEALLRELTAAAGMEDVTASSAGTYASPGEPASIGAVAAMDQMGADPSMMPASCPRTC